MRKHASDFEKEMIIGLKEISNQTNVHETTYRDIVKKYYQICTTNRKNGSGKPKMFLHKHSIIYTV